MRTRLAWHSLRRGLSIGAQLYRRLLAIPARRWGVLCCAYSLTALALIAPSMFHDASHQPVAAAEEESVLYGPWPAPTMPTSPTSTLPPFTEMPTAAPTITETPLLTPTPTATATPTATPPSAPTRAPAAGPPTRIRIPAIRVDAPVVEIRWQTFVDHRGNEVTGWKVADYATGWHFGSAYPGEAENCVISGHNNFRGEVFRDLYKLGPGAEVLLYVGDEEYRYIVTDAFILKESGESAEVQQANARWIAATGDERLTLVSCWPYLTATHRVIVICRPLPSEAEHPQTPAKAQPTRPG